MISETLLFSVNPDPSSTFPVFGKEDAIHRTPVDLHPIVRRAVDKCQCPAMASGVSLRFYSKVQCANILGDEDRIEQIVTDLIHCCLGMTSPGDAVQVKLLYTEHASRAFARIIIKDNGYGIHPDMLERIFDAQENSAPFSCLPSIEKSMILQDGGICVRSLNDIGTRFALDFPILFD